MGGREGGREECARAAGSAGHMGAGKQANTAAARPQHRQPGARGGAAPPTHLEQAAVALGHAAAAHAAALGRRLRRLLRCCALLLLCSPQQLIIEVRDLGPLEQQVLNQRLEQRAALGRGRAHRQRHLQGRALHGGGGAAACPGAHALLALAAREARAGWRRHGCWRGQRRDAGAGGDRRNGRR